MNTMYQGFEVKDLRKGTTLDFVKSSDPFRPVRVQELDSHGSRLSHRMAVAYWDEEHTTDDGIYTPEEWKPITVTSSNYQLIPNREALDVVEQVLSQTGIAFTRKAALWNGVRVVAHWISVEKSGDIIGADSGPHPVHIGVRLTNSYDGSSQMVLEVFGVNFTCMNQFVASNVVESFKLRHTGGSDGLSVGEALNQLGDSFNRVVAMMTSMSVLTRIPLHVEDLVAAQSAITLPRIYWSDVLEGLGNRDNWTQGYPTMYTLFQSLTAVATHQVPGFSSIEASERVGTWAMTAYDAIPGPRAAMLPEPVNA